MVAAEAKEQKGKKSDATFIIHLDRPPMPMQIIGQGDLVLLYIDGLELENDDIANPILLDNFKKVMGQRFGMSGEEASEDIVRDESVEGQSGTKGAVDSEGIAMRAPSPLLDNPHHLLGIVEDTRRGGVSVRVLLRSPTVAPADLLDLEEVSAMEGESDDASSLEARDKTRMVVEFMLRREKSRMIKMANSIASRSAQWYMAKVMNLVTVYREFQSLMSFSDLLLRDHLMLSSLNGGEKRLNAQNRAKKRRRQAESEERFLITDELRETLQDLYNASQMEALQDCLKAEGITCIQGPPGTGKTTTIMGVLSVILNARTKTTADEGISELNLDMQMNNKASTKLTPESFKRQIMKASPWIYDPNYSPWYDNQVCRLEDLEDPTPLANAIKDNEYIDLMKNTNVLAPKRVLVCAPSNAAIDEILRRLTARPEQGGGIFDFDGRRFNPQVLRCGPNSHPDLKPWTLTHRVADRVQATAASNPQGEELIKMKLLEEAQVVCATLSVAGSKELITFSGGFDTVVVDEASQGVELSTIIPLKLNCRRLILVGDPRQLPATVFSKVALDLGYDQSLFQRLERAGHKINMLSVQYRMHPKISIFPRKTFYDGQLIDYDKVEETAKPPIPYYSIPIFRPLVFFSVESAESSQNASKVNMEEIQLVLQLLDLLNCLFSALGGKYGDNWKSKIAVISPYAEQVKICSKQIKALFGVKPGDPCPIDVNTVDGFQGREKDIVLFSAVRAQSMAGKIGSRKANVGFLADVRRMNVALTRARINMWVIGNGPYLAGNPIWGKFWKHANETESVFNVNFKNQSKDSFFKHWLASYFNRQPTARQLFAEHVPAFVERIEREVKLLREVQEELDAEAAAAAAAAESS
eukprot:Gregarina_sp_Poly_1__7182@NODE_393_length_8957_cov_1164_871316_g322_i0_p1_GENE_NODE_393_length_8957_cov_1164_871316_g322_i0NODE_393_length_8957_cov_1164_871316_g322_i0_p1_ORF_typecomplete_len993_score171_62AAA_12/PF13087_6/6_1e03AAA_12/PF13087_6/2_5e03AAA_12/PF13087_6/9_5e53AAA_11/PF13086_6/2_1e46AAA_30/PF13604_6/1_1e17Viral_helicase1/PF01443_18/9_9Viral_helicase1/PF01443_18/1_4e10AAA_19/PF13245_6/1_1e03AAA_19/PF13245_6/0_00023AAA_19/PF13245_6/1_5e06ResIII/PF04851_15/0_0082ResIII/PF04851_15/8_2T